jgi:hypothetical protein
MATDNKKEKLMNCLFATFLVLNIVLTSANLYTMYQKKKCSCKEKEEA